MKKIFYPLAAICLFFPSVVFGDMASTNYHVYSDSIGVSGGDFSSSSSYTLTDTIGESPVGDATSTSYTVRGGFQAMTKGTLSFSLSSTALNLGTLSTTTISSAGSVATVSCDDAGYTLTISNPSGAMPTAVADGAVTAGAEEYGVAVVGPNSAVAGDAAVVNGLVLVNSPQPVNGEQSTVTFKAAMSPVSVAGTYNQTMDLVASANF